MSHKLTHEDKVKVTSIREQQRLLRNQMRDLSTEIRDIKYPEEKK